MARDNFPESVIRLLRDRVAHRCSKPSCRVPTSAPHDADALTNIGKAAHICAASPGGPRYDAKMTKEQRKSFSNGIWLCANHADEVDKDISGHTVELLRRWKKEAEASAKTELGRPQPKASDAVDMLTQALTGAPKSFLATSIHNAHSASAFALENLDPRFNVSSSYDPQMGARFFLSAKERVDFSLKMEPETLTSVALQYSRFLDHGVGFEVDAQKITLDGSPLLSHISAMACSEEGKLQIGLKPVKAVTKLALVDPVSGRHESLDDVQGELVVGQKFYTFSGTCMGGLQGLTFTKALESDTNVSGVDLSFHFEHWRGRLITQLPWFSKIMKILEAIESGWDFELSLEVEGERLFADSVRLHQATDASFSFLLRYTEMARELATFLGLDIPFIDGITIPAEQIEILARAVETSRGYFHGIDEFKPPARLEIEGFERDAEAFNEQITRFNDVSVIKPIPWAVQIFATNISMTDMAFTFNHCSLERAERAERDGMRQRFEIFPEPGFTIEYRFDLPK